jgi:hypothetical protein
MFCDDDHFILTLNRKLDANIFFLPHETKFPFRFIFLLLQEKENRIDYANVSIQIRSEIFVY